MQTRSHFHEPVKARRIVCELAASLRHIRSLIFRANNVLEFHHPDFKAGYLNVLHIQESEARNAYRVARWVLDDISLD